MIKNALFIIIFIVIAPKFIYAENSSKEPIKDYDEQFADFLTVIVGMRNIACKNKEREPCLKSFMPFEELCKKRTFEKTGNIATKTKVNEFTRRYAICLASERLFRETKSFWEYEEKLSKNMGIKEIMAKDGKNLSAIEIIAAKIFIEELKVHYPNEIKKYFGKSQGAVQNGENDF